MTITGGGHPEGDGTPEPAVGPTAPSGVSARPSITASGDLVYVGGAGSYVAGAPVSLDMAAVVRAFDNQHVFAVTALAPVVAEVGRQVAEKLDALYRECKAQFEDESWSQYVEGKLAALDLAEQRVREWTGAE